MGSHRQFHSQWLMVSDLRWQTPKTFFQEKNGGTDYDALSPNGDEFDRSLRITTELLGPNDMMVPRRILMLRANSY